MPPAGSAAVGTNWYCWPATTLVFGDPEMAGGAVATGGAGGGTPNPLPLFESPSPLQPSSSAASTVAAANFAIVFAIIACPVAIQ